ncbi:MAG: hypothetical protein UDG94_08515 [Peptococcaceae bacterium]|nr:hypothetical protein [Peptococcaceae bacterium]
MVKMIGLKAQNDGDRFAFSTDDHFVFGGKQPFKGLRAAVNRSSLASSLIA